MRYKNRRTGDLEGLRVRAPVNEPVLPEALGFKGKVKKKAIQATSGKESFALFHR